MSTGIGKRVLIVMDDLAVASALERELSLLGCHVVACVGCSAGVVRAAAACSLDLALVQSPLRADGSAGELVLQLREKFGLPSIVVLDPEVHADTLEQCACMAPLGYLRQPIAPIDLQLALLLAWRQIAQGQATELSRRERELDLRDQVLRAQQLGTVAVLAASAVHDFNNLLMALRANVHHLSCVSTRDSQVLRECDAILEQGTALTKQLLALAMPRAVEPRPFQVVPALLETLGLARRLFPQIEIEMQLAADSGCISLDRNHFGQAVLNLLINARDAMPLGGTVSVSSEAVAGDMCRLSITDQGHGMGASDLERAFEPFFTTKPSGAGTGLGLTSVREIVTAAGGRVSLLSTPEKGMKVTIELPLVEGDGRS